MVINGRPAVGWTIVARLGAADGAVEIEVKQAPAIPTGSPARVKEPTVCRRSGATLSQRHTCIPENNEVTTDKDFVAEGQGNEESQDAALEQQLSKAKA
jgi:hypothetical protein